MKRETHYDLSDWPLLPGLSRERDELLALLDVKERERYMKTCSRSSDDHYSNYSSAEVTYLLVVHHMYIVHIPKNRQQYINHGKEKLRIDAWKGIVLQNIFLCYPLTCNLILMTRS